MLTRLCLAPAMALALAATAALAQSQVPDPGSQGGNNTWSGTNNYTGTMEWGGSTILPAASLPLPTLSAPGGVVGVICPAHNWLSSIPTITVQPSCAQPDYTDLAHNPVMLVPHGYASGPYYTSAVTTTGAESVPAANRIYFAPIFFGAPETFTKLSIDVTTAVSSANCEIGIYNDAGNMPGALLVDGGAVSVAATGQVENTGLSIAVNAGEYWTAIDCSAASVGVYGTAAQTTGNILGFSTGSSAFGNYYTNSTYGALPASISTPTLSTGAQFNIYFRY